MLRTLGSLLAAIGLLTACSSSVDGSSGSNGSGLHIADASIEGYASASCDHLDRCSPGVISLDFTDKATCVTTFTTNLKAELALKGVTITNDQANACVAKLPAQGCDDPMPVECQFKGSIAVGAACASDIQCASGSCFIETSTASTTAFCGKCKDLVQEGGDCSQASCAPGLSCTSANKCTKGAAEGGACTDAFDCSGKLQCIAGKCAKALGAGTACSLTDDTTGTCDASQSLYCTPQATTPGAGAECAAVTFAAVGAPCGLSDGAPAHIILCAGGQCIIPTGTANGKGSCVAALAEGAACTPDTGDASMPSCAFGLVCTTGKCTKPALSTCNP